MWDMWDSCGISPRRGRPWGMGGRVPMPKGLRPVQRWSERGPGVARETSGRSGRPGSYSGERERFITMTTFFRLPCRLRGRFSMGSNPSRFQKRRAFGFCSTTARRMLCAPCCAAQVSNAGYNCLPSPWLRWRGTEEHQTDKPVTWIGVVTNHIQDANQTGGFRGELPKTNLSSGPLPFGRSTRRDTPAEGPGGKPVTSLQ